MPTRRLRRRLLDRLQRNVKLAGEVGLAGVLMAVVYACGGSQLGQGIPDAEVEGGGDGQTPCERDPSLCVTEAAMVEGGVVEAAEAGCFEENCSFEAATEGGFSEAGSFDAGGSGSEEGGEAGFFDGPVTEAAMEAGDHDAH